MYIQNKNCISYGMFDSSDDYEIIQKYVPLKNVPAFVLFTFNKKNQSEQFIAEYSILKKDQIDFIQWIAPLVGVSIKKKDVQVEKKEEKPFDQFNYNLTEIVNSQNNEYEEMEKLYKLKREQSRIKK